MVQKAPYGIDPDDPRAPSEEQWADMTPAEREGVVATLPSEVPEELAPPEGDAHRKAKSSVLDALDSFFRKTGRRVYVTSEIGVYYPKERRFAPDILAVVDVDPHERDKWVVSHEGKGLDFVLEVLVHGDDEKDLERNVTWFARLGIPEYFVFDKPRERLWGYLLPPGGGRTYRPIVPQAGRYRSDVLGLDIAVDGGRPRFYLGTAALLESSELVAKLGSMMDDVLKKKDDLARELEEARSRAQKEAERAQKEAERAQKEAERAQKEAERAQKEAERADAAERKLRELTDRSLVRRICG